MSLYWLNAMYRDYLQLKEEQAKRPLTAEEAKRLADYEASYKNA